MKPVRLDCDRQSLVRVRRMYRIVAGGHIHTIHAISGVGFYRIVLQYRRYQTMGIFSSPFLIS